MKIFLSFVFTLFTLTSIAQFSKHVIRFTDKKGTISSLSAPSDYLSTRAIERRNRQFILIDSTDLPVSAHYIQVLQNIQGVSVKSVSKWLNQVLIHATDQNAINQIKNLPFVRQTKPVALTASPEEYFVPNRKYIETISPLNPSRDISGIRRNNEIHDIISYGATFDQVHIHEGEFLHNKGYRGKNLVIAVIDAGYTAYDINPAFDSLRIQGRLLGGYDFVLNQTGVYKGNTHGAYCLSVMASNIPGKMVGTASWASYWLLRSEDAASEYPVEEHYWAVAAEFADSTGADMISSSLGYTTFDDPTLNHTHATRDGNTAMSTRAADYAARKGMIVMNSAGNSGGSPSDERYIAVPADGDSVVAVGAVRTDGIIAGFSSIGPSGSGKVKPDMVSIGQGTILANTSGIPVSANGTSFSNPNLAGLIACLWEAFPEFTNMEIIQAVKESADRFLNPDYQYGYGVPNFRIAYNNLLIERTKRNAEKILGNEILKAYPVPFGSEGFSIVHKSPSGNKSEFILYDATGRLLYRKSIETVAGQIYTIPFHSVNLNPGVYYIEYRGSSTRQTLQVIRK